MMKNQIKCPKCHKPVDWEKNPDRPFCSERCRLIDLGCWADQTYHIPEDRQDRTTEDNILNINRDKKDTERS